MRTLVSGGAKGVTLKSKFPNITACADNDGFILAVLVKLIVRTAWGINLSHYATENVGSHVQRPAIRWVSNVRMARSAALQRWMWGGTF